MPDGILAKRTQFSSILSVPLPCFHRTRFLAMLRPGKIGRRRSGGGRAGQKEHPCMVSPLRNSPDRLDSAADDLQRLESSIQWIKREGMLARLEAGHGAPAEIRKLPRAAVLP